MKGVFVCVTVVAIEIAEEDQVYQLYVLVQILGLNLVVALDQVVDLDQAVDLGQAVDLDQAVETDQTSVAEDQIAALEMVWEAHAVMIELQGLGKTRETVDNFKE